MFIEFQKEIIIFPIHHPKINNNKKSMAYPTLQRDLNSHPTNMLGKKMNSRKDGKEKEA